MAMYTIRRRNFVSGRSGSLFRHRLGGEGQELRASVVVGSASGSVLYEMVTRRVEGESIRFYEATEEGLFSASVPG